MLFDPWKRQVNPSPLHTRTRTVPELILLWTIHDQHDTMSQHPRITNSIRTGLTRVAVETGTGSEAERYDQLVFTSTPKERPVIAVPPDLWVRMSVKMHCHGRWPFSDVHHGRIRRAVALHKPSTMDQPSLPNCGLIGEPCAHMKKNTFTSLQGRPTKLWNTMFAHSRRNASLKAENNASSSNASLTSPTYRNLPPYSTLESSSTRPPTMAQKMLSKSHGCRQDSLWKLSIRAQVQLLLLCKGDSHCARTVAPTTSRRTQPPVSGGWSLG